MPRKYLPVSGTFTRSRSSDDLIWCRRGSTFDTAATAAGWERVEQDRDPDKPDVGYWQGNLEGLLIQSVLDKVRSWMGLETVDNWQLGADRLRALIEERRREWMDTQTTVTIVAHSHGGQVAALALSDIHRRAWPLLPAFCRLRLITVDMPVRRSASMQHAYQRASRLLESWTHLYSSRWNPVRLLGAGILLGPCECPYADRNVQIQGGHSGALNKLEYIGQVIGELRRGNDE